MTHLKSVLFLAAVISAPVVAQQAPSQQQLIANHEAKLAADFIPFGGWLTDYDAARAEAASTGKLIFAYFSRSYSA